MRKFYDILRMALLVCLFSNSFIVKGQISFAETDTLLNTEGTRAVKYFDLNKDDAIDIVLKSQTKIWIKYGAGDGTFGDREELYDAQDENVAWLSNFVELNDDDYWDLAILTDNKIRILLGNEDGFEEQSVSEEFDRSFFPIDFPIIWKDFDSDGKLDLIAIASSGIQINKTWDEDINSFETLVESTNTWDVEVEDFNNDDRVDLVVSNYDGITIYQTDSEGLLSEYYHTDETHGGIQIADTNLDGFLDLVFIDAYLDEFYVYENDNENATFNKVNVTPESHFHLYQYDVADIDNNGTPDIVFNYGHGSIQYLPNSDGNFEPMVEILERDQSQQILSLGEIKVLDMNGDSQLDLLTHQSGTIEIWGLDESISVQDYERIKLYPDVRENALRDLDKDGHLDFIAMSANAAFYVNWGEGEGQFEEIIEIPTDLKYQNNFLISDINQDNHDDLIFNTKGYFGGVTKKLYVMYGEETRTFGSPVELKNVYNYDKGTVQDVSGDETAELCYIVHTGDLLVRDKIVCLDPSNDNVDEYLDSPFTIEPAAGHISDFQFFDIDDDGDDDVVSLHEKDNKISFMYNEGGTYTGAVKELDQRPYAIAMTDFDGDEVPELLYTFQDVLLVEKRQEDGTYAIINEHSFDPSRVANEIHVKDFDGDGDEDVIIGLSTNYDHVAFRNDQGELQANDFIDLGAWQSFQITFGDINGDEKIDVVGSDVVGRFSININNSVSKPSITGLEATVENIEYDQADLSFNEQNSSGVLVVISESNELTETPEDGTFYEANAELGLGSEIGGGHVVAASGDLSTTITGLMSSTTYFAHVFEYNQNEPQNTLINYSAEHLTVEFTTANSILITQEFGEISFDEDTQHEVDLSNYINDVANNVYTVSSENTNVIFEIEGTIVSFSPAEDYFGEGSAIISVTNDRSETFEHVIDFTINPINDPPSISAQSNLSTDEEVAITLDISMVTIEDPDNVTEDFTMTISTGDDYSVDGLTITPTLNFDQTLTVPVTVSDGATDSESFDLQIVVNPVNDAPVIIDQTATLELNIGEELASELFLFEVPFSALNIEDPDNTVDEMTLTILEGDGYEIDDNKFYVTEKTDAQFAVNVMVSDGELESETFGVDVEITVISNVSDLSSGLSIWPNPVSERLNITLDKEFTGQTRLTLIDVSGKVFFDETISKPTRNMQCEMDIQKFPKGLYLLKLSNGAFDVTKNILIK